MGFNFLSVPFIDHDDVIKWKYFPRYWPFVRGIHRSTVNSPHKGQWRGALMFSFICVWINSWVNNHETGNLRRYRVHFDVIATYFWHNTPLLFLPVHEWMSHDKVGVASDGEKYSTSIPYKLTPELFDIIRLESYGSIKPQYPGMTAENFL